MTDEEKRSEEAEEKTEAAAEEAPAEEKSEEAPAEEKSEEAPAEEKSEAAAAEEKSEAAAEEAPQEAAPAAAMADHSADDHDHHGPHITSAAVLLGVAGALMILTILTVAVTSVDFGPQVNLAIAMVIATIKAALVMAYFMHLAWDKKFNVIAFTSSFLFVILFLSMTVLDRSEYEYKINDFLADNPSEN